MAIVEDVKEDSSSQMVQTECIDNFFHEMRVTSRFQVFFQLATMYVSLTLCYFFMLSVFTTSDSPWKCVNSTINSSVSTESEFCRYNRNKTFTSNDQHFEKRCLIDRKEWDFVKPKDYSALTEFDLVCDRTYISALVGSSYHIGGIIGSIFSGALSDSFGRKPVVLGCMLITSLFSVSGAFVSNVWQLICLNVILGASCVGCYFTLYVFHQEVVATRFRTTSSSLVLCCFSLSFLLLDLITYYERYWRKLHLYVALPTIISITAFSFIPESPRWCLSVGKITEANKTKDWIDNFNGNKCATKMMLKPTKTTPEKKYTYLDLFRHIHVAVQVVSIALIWFSVSLVMYAFMLGAPNLGGNMYESFFFSVVGDFPSYTLTPYLSNRFGRKIIVIGGLAVSGVLAGFMALIPRFLYYPKIVLMVVSTLIACTAMNVTYTFTFELFPTPIRSQGISLCIIFERIGICVVPFITNMLQKVSHRLPFFLVCGVAVAAALFGLILPETNGKPTRECFEDFFRKKSKGNIDTKVNGVENAGNDMNLDEEAV